MAKKIKLRKVKAIFNKNSNRTKAVNLYGKIRRGGVYF